MVIVSYSAAILWVSLQIGLGISGLMLMKRAGQTLVRGTGPHYFQFLIGSVVYTIIVTVMLVAYTESALYIMMITLISSTMHTNMSYIGDRGVKLGWRFFSMDRIRMDDITRSAVTFTDTTTGRSYTIKASTEASHLHKLHDTYRM